MAGWQPILSGPEADVAREIVDEIATRIAERRPESPDLGRGASGWALFLAYHAEALGSVASDARGTELLDWSTRKLAELPSSASFFSGFSGIAWAVEHIEGDGSPGANVAIDEALELTLSRPAWSDAYDLTDGLVGLAVYALERPRGATVERCLERISEHLVALADRQRSGVTWRTRPEVLAESILELAPKGNYNLGAAHGIPGVLYALGRIAARGLGGDAASAALLGGFEWLFSQEGDTRPCRFPGWLAIDGDPYPVRLAWCYGDLGLAAATLAAARAVGDQAAENRARAIADHAAKIPVHEARISHVELCHGAFGNAHIFNRLYQATGDERYLEAATRWFRQGFSMRRSGNGLAGLGDDPGFITGAAGIGLALLAAITPMEPTWDRALLLDVPPDNES